MSRSALPFALCAQLACACSTGVDDRSADTQNGKHTPRSGVIRACQQARNAERCNITVKVPELNQEGQVAFVLIDRVQNGVIQHTQQEVSHKQNTATFTAYTNLCRTQNGGESPHGTVHDLANLRGRIRLIQGVNEAELGRIEAHEPSDATNAAPPIQLRGCSNQTQQFTNVDISKLTPSQ